MGFGFPIFGRPSPIIFGDSMKAFWIGLSLLITTAISFSYGHEFGMVEGSRYQRQVDHQKLQSCQRVITANMYAKDSK